MLFEQTIKADDVLLDLKVTIVSTALQKLQLKALRILDLENFKVAGNNAFASTPFRKLVA